LLENNSVVRQIVLATFVAITVHFVNGRQSPHEWEQFGYSPEDVKVVLSQANEYTAVLVDEDLGGCLQLSHCKAATLAFAESQWVRQSDSATF
jgi:hypothetical protein